MTVRSYHFWRSYCSFRLRICHLKVLYAQLLHIRNEFLQTLYACLLPDYMKSNMRAYKWNFHYSNFINHKIFEQRLESSACCANIWKKAVNINFIYSGFTIGTFHYSVLDIFHVFSKGFFSLLPVFYTKNQMWEKREIGLSLSFVLLN